jgi:hypothetical protein
MTDDAELSAVVYPQAMVFPSGFIEPCLPSKVARPPYGPLRVHEING